MLFLRYQIGDYIRGFKFNSQICESDSTCNRFLHLFLAKTSRKNYLQRLFENVSTVLLANADISIQFCHKFNQNKDKDNSRKYLLKLESKDMSIDFIVPLLNR